MLDRFMPSTILLVGCACDVGTLRAAVAGKGAFANIPPMPQHSPRSAFSRFLYRSPNPIERLINKSKYPKAVAMRYGKCDNNFLACVRIASIRIGLCHDGSVS